MYRFLRKLSPMALELLSEIKNYHLTRAQYRSLLDSDLAQTIRELRKPDCSYL